MSTEKTTNWQWPSRWNIGWWIKLIQIAPCNRAGLALMVATHAFTVAAREMGKDTFANAREVADLIVETMRPEAPKLKVVP